MKTNRKSIFFATLFCSLNCMSMQQQLIVYSKNSGSEGFNEMFASRFSEQEKEIFENLRILELTTEKEQQQNLLLLQQQEETYHAKRAQVRHTFEPVNYSRIVAPKKQDLVAKFKPQK